MNTVQYIVHRIRKCKSLYDSPNGKNLDGTLSKENTCFQSVSTATYEYHGDDAIGYGANFMVVADGVSGTVKSSGALAKRLVSESLKQLSALQAQSLDTDIKTSDLEKCMQNVIKKVVGVTQRKGRLDSTLSAAYFDQVSKRMFVFTIGDCKCILLRKKALIFESDSIIYDFNVPAVVSNNSGINYSADVKVQSCLYECGDVCLMFSDGVHDNLYLDQILECASQTQSNAESIAKRIVACVVDTFTHSTSLIPFAVSAASFCKEALAELESSGTHRKQYEAFFDKCQNLLGSTKSREILCKEQRVRKLAFYSATNLLNFAQKKLGKKDDVSVCVAILS
ncbi:unnamed protein product [Albugo candida]|uniref:Protein phosphatase n=1 Tax=Albugo candida TaxID=65357 RepID=A0A024G8T4_9STRA|nr:unnamed protein product [Albugo candida]|eukprot:CCI42925.1 unnamed protein product [Albugo candida]